MSTCSAPATEDDLAPQPRRPRELSIYYLQMTGASQLRLPARPAAGLTLRAVDPPDGAINCQMYKDVGQHWNWLDRLTWPASRWQAYAEQPALATWLGCVQDEAVGYFELELQTHHNVQIAYFGLRPEHVGRGLGGALLAAALEQAWSIEGARRVWLHTCSHDHPHALRNYQARGLTIYRTVHRRI